MLSNRSIPHATVIPVLAYPDVNQATAWLCAGFGFDDPGIAPRPQIHLKHH
jgi:hypothetical protein